MQSPSGIVISVDHRTAQLSVDRSSACARCSEGRGCGGGILNGRLPPAILTVDIPQGLQLKVGDVVSLTLEPRRILHAALLVYALPLLGAVLGLLVAELSAGPLSDSTAVLIALLGLACGFAVGRNRLRRSHCLQQFTPVIAADAAR